MPPDEPVRLPCSNPIECQAAKNMVASNRWMEWRYLASKTFPGSTGNVTIAGYDHELFLAYVAGAPGSHPPPPRYPYRSGDKPPNAVTVYTSPPPAD